MKELYNVEVTVGIGVKKHLPLFLNYYHDDKCCSSFLNLEKKEGAT